MINGGYILQPRKIDESAISESPPHVREIWLYLLRKANHKEYKGIKRGQVLTRYSQIIDDLSWRVGYRIERYKKHHCEIAMKVLTKEKMITTSKTTMGMIVTICNYDYYQNPDNYENDNENYTKAIRQRQSNDTIYKNDKNDKNEEYKEKFNFKTELLNLGVESKIVSDWLTVRRKKKAANTETAFNRLKKEIEKSGLSANECIKIATESSWQGFKSEWVNNETNSKNNNRGFKSDTTERTIKSISEKIEQEG